MDKTAYFEQMRRKRRNEILAAARKMLLTQGVSAFNIQQLARSLDVSTVTLYKYFKNIDDIMLALKEQITEDAFSMLIFSADSSEAANALDAFLNLMQKFYDEILRCRDDVSLLLLFEVHTRNMPLPETGGNVFHTYIQKLDKKMTELLNMGKKDGSIKSDLNVPEAVQFISQINVAMLQSIGLLSENCYEKENAAIQVQIGQLISLFALYLSES